MIKKENEYSIIVFFIVATLFIFSKNACSQEEVIRVDTDLVTVPATVFDRNGRYVTNLEKENFKLFEDETEQEISFFEPVSQPLTVFLLLDNSGSMNSRLNELAKASNNFVNQLRPDDQIIVALFDNWVDVVNKGSSIKDLQNNVIDVRRKDDPLPITVVYDAVEFALKKARKIRGRKAIILFSDGVGSGYSASAKSNLRDAEEGESLIYTIQFNTYSEIAPQKVYKKEYYKKLKVADAYMQNLAQITGGRRFQVKDVSNLKETFKKIADELGQQYRIGYYPKDAGKKGERRQIKVKVNIPNTAVRSRDSYIVGANKN